MAYHKTPARRSKSTGRINTFRNRCIFYCISSRSFHWSEWLYAEFIANLIHAIGTWSLWIDSISHRQLFLDMRCKNWAEVKFKSRYWSDMPFWWLLAPDLSVRRPISCNVTRVHNITWWSLPGTTFPTRERCIFKETKILFLQRWF